jgi:altronate dehydratase small subunit
MSNDLDPRLLQISPDDNIAVAKRGIGAGEIITVAGRQVTLPHALKPGDKIALRPIAVEEKIIKYGAPIGSATQAIANGEHVHTHNLASDYLPTFARGEEHAYYRQ